MTDPESQTTSPSGEDREPNCAVVAIGASAGGLEAVTELLRSLPPTHSLALVLVQHLDPNHESTLASLLARETTMTVVQACDGVRIEPDHLYVIPPNALISMRDCRLFLAPRSSDRARHLPIDHFMCSLAEDLGNRSIGVILSGGGSDGTIGLEAIKSEGGITFAQDQSARQASMPRNAAAAGVVDFVLSPRGIAAELATLAGYLQSGSAPEALVGVAQPMLHQILAVVREQCGVDFTHYKPNTVLRRLARRMALLHIGGPDEYLNRLKEGGREARDFCEDILIRVTEFFRDPETFESLARNGFPQLLQRRNPGDTIRVWVPGCASGEEVYSLAIALTEAIEAVGSRCALQIFGTDLSTRSIEIARAGRYLESIAATVSPERLERFFARVEGGYQIARRIREICVFSRQDVTRDPPLARMDMISCRNLLIYLGPVLQRRVLGIFAYSLRHGGMLLLGNSEAIGALSEQFEPLDPKHKIYRRDGGGSGLPDFPPSGPGPNPILRAPQPGPPGRLPEALAADILLREYAPPGFLLNAERQVVSFRGDVGRYLVSPSGPEGLDVLRLVRPEVVEILRPALDAAMATGTVARGDLATPEGEAVELVVRPVAEPGFDCHYLVIFELPVHGLRRAGVAEATAGREREGGRTAGDLALDLASTRAYMQRLVEELRSANEEGQSANEELQSTNEELQTAKEELQSSNEELTTTNEEMQSRNDQLNTVNSDLVNLLGSLQVAILMLDRDLRIRRYTPACERLFKIIHGDLGRPISHLRAGFDIPDLTSSLRAVIDSGEPSEREVTDERGRWYSLRLHPYRGTSRAIDGVVLQMLDIDGLKRALEDVEKARGYAAAIVATVRESLVVLDSELRVRSVNDSFGAVFGIRSAEAVGQSIQELAGGLWNTPAIREMLQAARDGRAASPDVEIAVPPAFGGSNKGGGERIFALNARRIGSADDELSILLAIEDISDRKRAAEARYRRLFETAKDGILMTDAEAGAVSDVNPRALHLLGVEREAAIGRHFWQIMPMAGGDAEGRGILSRLRAGEMVRFTEVEWNRDGRTQVLETVANMYREQDRQVIQLNIRDITERRQTERQLQQTAKLESLGILAGGIAHDFNNLLTGIMGNASLALLDAQGSPRYRSALTDVVRASQRAAELTSQMLAYAGKGRYATRPLDVSEAVREIGTLVMTSIPKNVKFEMKLGSGLPPVEADVSQLQQVIMNLIINGAESIDEGRRGVVTIRTALEEFDPARFRPRVAAEGVARGSFVLLEVRDTGAGMDEDVLSRIFDPFFTTKFTGRGLGLAAVQGIVRSHGGALVVESERGKGTTFRVYFPALRRPAPAPAAGSAPSDDRELRGQANILVVDDEEAVRSMAKAILESHGYRALTAENGGAAVEMVRERGPEIHAVILDLTMPVMGGEEALAGIRAIRPDVPVVLSTGYDSAAVSERLRPGEIAAVLQKPYTALQLLSVVKKLGPLQSNGAQDNVPSGEPDV